MNDYSNTFKTWDKHSLIVKINTKMVLTNKNRFVTIREILG